MAGALRVHCGATIDVTALGFAGGTGSHPNGHAPAGVAGAKRDAGGGRHGGTGVTDTHAGPAGPVYDSVYVPHLAGGGGSYTSGDAGGGVLTIEAGTLTLEGRILARGADACGDGAGAGGSVVISADVVRGTGSIDASGGGLAATCNSNTGAGGGGRVSIYADSFDGFDPAAQVRAYGGWTWNAGKFAAPGTIFSQLPAQSHGVLLIDAGEHNGADRRGPATRLPRLGQGTVAAFEAAGADAWVSTSGGFRREWLGAGMALTNAAGTELGTFRVAALDGAGRARLTGAAAQTAAATFRGEYRFDRVDLVNGAGLEAEDRVASTDLTFAGEAEVSGEVHAANALVASGAIVRPGRGRRPHPLRLWHDHGRGRGDGERLRQGLRGEHVGAGRQRRFRAARRRRQPRRHRRDGQPRRVRRARSSTASTCRTCRVAAARTPTAAPVVAC